MIVWRFARADVLHAASVIGYDLQTLLQSVQAMPTEITTSNPMPESVAPVAAR